MNPRRCVYFENPNILAMLDFLSRSKKGKGQFSHVVCSLLDQSLKKLVPQIIETRRAFLAGTGSGAELTIENPWLDVGGLLQMEDDQFNQAFLINPEFFFGDADLRSMLINESLASQVRFIQSDDGANLDTAVVPVDSSDTHTFHAAPHIDRTNTDGRTLRGREKPRETPLIEMPSAVRSQFQL